ncbi:MAG: hypothetical protein NTY30_02730 [Candidatus Berkelbacteria bacterium]|nr:hypothetical protein [Candidatus Berkelbacteria bacterium]
MLVVVRTPSGDEMATVTTMPQEEGDVFVDGSGVAHHGKVQAYISGVLDGHGLDEADRIVIILTKCKPEK